MGLPAHRPRAVALDVFETLFRLDALRPGLEALELFPGALERWFALLRRDGFALAATGTYQPFARVAEAALHALARSAGVDLAPDQTQWVLQGLSELEAHPDAEPALATLAAAGVPVLALTNGPAGATNALLARTNLLSYLSEVVSTEQVGSWTPRAEVYHHAASRAGVAPERLALVAVHPWDIHGASRAGLVTGWVSCIEGPFPAIFDYPHMHADTVAGVVERLLGLPER